MNVYNGHMIQIMISNQIFVNCLPTSIMIHAFLVTHNVNHAVSKTIVPYVHPPIHNLDSHVIVAKVIIWMNRILAKSVLRSVQDV